MWTPLAFSQSDKIREEVRAVEAELKPDVVRIRYKIEQDWKDEWSIFFRITLSDDAAYHHLREVADNAERRLAESLDFVALGVYPYHRFRSASEQATMREEAWA
jgi:hypothetical protein